ncbi:hypothetical protein [uncultured Paraglaciecola sp.]|uniref:hypothetical protein n=1 Tax=uncultured Paraglaciecola sp. TaxID=1765024 RepID=UPI00260D837E|nr:hypothetical protein [uncultured Paraglaciecola sp.]
MTKKIDLKDLEAKSDQLNAVDFIKPIVFRIVKVDYFPRQQQCIHIHLDGFDGRPYKPCKSMLRGLVQIWSEEYETWVGKLIELYCEPSVKWAGAATGGIRIKGVSGIAAPFDLVVQLNKKQREIQTWDVIPDNQPVAQEFIANHFIVDINEAESNDAITVIAQHVKKTFGGDALDQLKDTVIEARKKFSESQAVPNEQ